MKPSDGPQPQSWAPAGTGNRGTCPTLDKAKWTVILFFKLRRLELFNETPSWIYRMSLAIRDHTVLHFSFLQFSHLNSTCVL